MESNLILSLDSSFLTMLEKSSKEKGLNLQNYLKNMIEKAYEQEMLDKTFLLASERSLAKDWNKKCEDEAWNHM